MKLVVNELPKEKKDCLFSELHHNRTNDITNYHQCYVCELDGNFCEDVNECKFLLPLKQLHIECSSVGSGVSYGSVHERSR